MDGIRFAHLARVLHDSAKSLDLPTPMAFRSPPSTPGEDRTLRRTSSGTAVLAVRMRGRPDADVIGDLVDGVLAANGARDRGDLRFLLLEAAWSICEGDVRPEIVGPVSREALGLPALPEPKETPPTNPADVEPF